MKKLTFLFLASLALLVQSCEDWPPGHGTGGGTSNNSVVGEWRWISSEGGLFSMVYTPENQGWDATLKLASDKTYKLEHSNSLRQEGTYTEGSLNNQKTVTFSRPNDTRAVWSYALPVDENFVSFRGKDTIVFSGTGADMLTYTYVRAR